MEPAGSQGVWALDDYQFVAFIWGAAQFINHPRFRPKSIPDYDMAEALAKDYHLSACIKYISQVKTGPFPEHSNQLWNISAVATWEKVNSGLIKMYRAEVLSKFPVIQHVLFGSIFTLKESANPLPEVPIANTRGGTGPRPGTQFIKLCIFWNSIIEKEYFLLSGASTLPGTIPPMGVMPPRPSGAMPPMGVMPPRASGEMLPMGAKPPKVSGTMSPMGVMPPRALGTMPPLGAMPPMGVLPPKSTLITEDSTSNSCTAKVTAEMK